jgi:hypothetical protein
MNRSALRLPTFVLLLSLSGWIATEITRAETSKTIDRARHLKSVRLKVKD